MHNRYRKSGSTLKIAFIALLGLLFSSALFADMGSDQPKPGLISPGGSLVIFYNSQGPLSYNLMTPKDLPKDAVDIGSVYCKSCQYGISLPLPTTFMGSQRDQLSGAAGNGSYKKALDNLKKEHPEVRGIYDVKVDLHTIRILTVYTKYCTEILARGYK